MQLNYYRKMLGRYCIGEVDEDADDSLRCSSIQYCEAGNELFYMTLKERVEAYFEKHKVCFSSKRISACYFEFWLLFFQN
jgi:hypothetical protein